MTVSGRHGSAERRVRINRYEPECLPLAAAARMSVDRFCDRISLTRSGGRLDIRFFSYDANHAYGFVLESSSDGRFVSVQQGLDAQPALSLELDADDDGVRYRWLLRTQRVAYPQAGVFDAAWLRSNDVDALEAALIPLGEVLSSFNRYEFEFADLPRDHPQHEPSPYSMWDERPIDGGCFLIFCFGSVGGSEGGGPGDNGQCEPGDPNYTPDQCPHDLTYATWPISKRVKIRKIDDEHFAFSWFIENKGTGPFNYGAAAIGLGDSAMPHFSFATLVPKDGAVPMVAYPGESNVLELPYRDNCFSLARFADPFQGFFGTPFPFLGNDMQPGQTVPHLSASCKCLKSSGRPKGKYRLYVHADPTQSYDTPGYIQNNIGNSGPWDWIHLKE